MSATPAQVKPLHVAAYIEWLGMPEPKGLGLANPDAYRMIQRRAKQAGIKTKVGNHSLRATGITDYLKNSGTLEHA